MFWLEPRGPAPRRRSSPTSPVPLTIFLYIELDCAIAFGESPDSFVGVLEICMYSVASLSFLFEGVPDAPTDAPTNPPLSIEETTDLLEMGDDHVSAARGGKEG